MRSGETPVFGFAVAFLAVIPQRSGGICFRTAIIAASY
jgi:hypothetical protein